LCIYTHRANAQQIDDAVGPHCFAGRRIKQGFSDRCNLRSKAFSIRRSVSETICSR
jgi:hypothetical protein